MYFIEGSCGHRKSGENVEIKIAINGYGRIGRCVLRSLYESDHSRYMKIVAINEPSDMRSIVHLTRFDSTHGRFQGEVSHTDNFLLINGDPIHVSFEKTFEHLPWAELDIDVVFECSGSYTERKKAEVHLESGAKKVVFSCPAENDVDATIVYGLNDSILTGSERIISNASCTTNCITHVISELDRQLGIDHGVITTIHSMMNDQPVIDAYHHPDLRRTRSSGSSIIPATTELAKGLDRLLPGLQGRFEAVSMRVPTINVSAMQLTACVKTATSKDVVNDILENASKTSLKGILGYTETPLVSCDFNHDPRSAVIDGTQTGVIGGTMINVMAWFDNEWGYSNRMLDTTNALFKAYLKSLESDKTQDSGSINIDRLRQ